MSRNWQALCILGLASLLMAGYAAFVRVVPWHAELAETNFQANLIRLQAFLFDGPPRTVLLGSSLSGRLVPDYFDRTQLAPLANLGLDGSSAAFGLDLVVARPPAMVIIEENTLLRTGDANDTLLAATLHSFGFRLSRHFPVLRAQYRLSSVLYAWLKLRVDRGRGSIPVTPSAAIKGAESSGLATSGETSLRAVKDRLRAQIQALRAQGCRIVLVRLPAGYHSGSLNGDAFRLGDDLAKEFSLRQVDLEAELSGRGDRPRYTDGMHLTPASARATSLLLAELLAKD